MRNKMKQWRRMAAGVKRTLVKRDMFIPGTRVGRSIKVHPQPPVWRGGPPSMCAPSPLLSALLKRQASL